jgi:predicted dienelactone hydrolase
MRPLCALQTGGGAVFYVSVLSLLLFFISLSASAFNAGIKYYPLSYHGQNFEYAMWYPTDKPERKQEKGLYVISAAENAPVADAVKGVVVLVHGFGGNMFGQHDTAEYLARGGYAVITVTYPDMWGLEQSDAVFHPVHLRPELSVLALENLRKVSGVNADAFKNVYTAGFSMGGYTAAILAGGKADLGVLKEYCGRDDAQILLCLPANRRKLEKLTDADINITLPNLRAAVLMAPAYGIIFGKDSFRDVKIPVSVYAAGLDSVVTGDRDSLYVASLIQGASVNVIKDADHAVFISPCAESRREKFYNLCEDDVGVDRISVHKKMNIEILHLFDTSKQ